MKKKSWAFTLTFAVLSFYFFPIVSLVFMKAFGISSTYFFYGNLILPGVCSLFVFHRYVKTDNNTQAVLMILGGWAGGPLSFYAGTYMGFLGSLLFISFYYLGWIILRSLQKKRFCLGVA